MWGGGHLGARDVWLEQLVTDRLKMSALEARLTALEDRLRILDILAGSAHSSDVASQDYWTEMFTEDAVMDRGETRPNDIGRTAIVAIVGAPEQHMAIEAGMAHLAMLPTITIEGDRARATGYLLVVVPDDNASRIELPGKGTSPGLSIYQLTVNRWELARTQTGWQVTRRIVRPIAAHDARQILAAGIAF
jgi:hypothetical protein